MRSDDRQRDRQWLTRREAIGAFERAMAICWAGRFRTRCSFVTCTPEICPDSRSASHEYQFD